MAYQPRHRAARTPVARKAAVSAAAALAVAAPVALNALPAEAAEVRTWERLANCESGGNWHINTGNGYYGGLQFSASTWRGYGGGKFAPYAHQATKREQITIAEKVLDGQGWGAWPACSAKLGLDASDAAGKPYTKVRIKGDRERKHRYDDGQRRRQVQAAGRFN